MIRLAAAALSISVGLLAILDVLALAYIITVDKPRLIGFNCSTGLIAFRDQEDEFGRCSMIERIGR